MARPAKKTRKTRRRRQKGAGTQEVKVFVYSDPNHEHRIHLNNLSEKRVDSISLGAVDYLNDHFNEPSSPNKYIVANNQQENLILIFYGTHSANASSIEKKNFPSGALQKILNTRVTIVVIENDVFYIKFSL